MTIPRGAVPEGALARVLASRAMARVVAHFVLRPEVALHFRALQRATGVSSRSLQVELARLEALGLVRAEREGKRVRWRAVEHRGWQVMRELVRAFAAPAELLRTALAGVPGIDAAFVYGSFARAEGVDEGSDVDVLVVGRVDDPETRSTLADVALQAAGLLGREVNLARYTPGRLAVRREHGFLRSVLRGPKAWLIGDERALAEEAA